LDSIQGKVSTTSTDTLIYLSCKIIQNLRFSKTRRRTDVEFSDDLKTTASNGLRDSLQLRGAFAHVPRQTVHVDIV